MYSNSVELKISFIVTLTRGLSPVLLIVILNATVSFTLINSVEFKYVLSSFGTGIIRNMTKLCEVGEIIELKSYSIVTPLISLMNFSGILVPFPYTVSYNSKTL